ncbi:MAG: dihydroneopterin aldolase [Alphaproteobacteria bacterium]|nr:dihydroneopterin aldolase [Alphaproteobacteria bacterium]MBF0251163.1 dihydroneopterin aldolase [Alphaproteobacteria bacterium]
MINPQFRLVPQPSIADARSGIRHVFVRDLVLNTFIGVHDHEKHEPQRVRINLDLAVFEGDASSLKDDIQNVVCYEEVSNAVRALLGRGHTNLVETMAEDIAAECLVHARVRSVRVRVEKLDVFEDAASVGVEIERFNPEV